MREQCKRIIAGHGPANYGEAIGSGTSDAFAGKRADVRSMNAVFSRA